jgi:FKBP-type peptidyl-prolyl cis-trans isomerase FklB
MCSRFFSSDLAFGLSGTVCLAEEQTAIESENDQASYSIGYQMGQNFRQQGVSFNLPILFRGIEDAVTESNPLISIN